MIAPDTYVFDDFFIALVDHILSLRGEDVPPINRMVFGIPILYDRVEHHSTNGDVTGWTYMLGREDVWLLTMTNLTSNAEQFANWKAAGDLDAAHRDLSLLKLAIT